MQESTWPANCPETLYDICIDYCALHLDKTLCCESAGGQLLLKSEVFLPPNVCDALLSRLQPVSRKHLSLLASPTYVNFQRVDVKSISDLTDAELQNLLVHHPTDLRISSHEVTEDSLELISSQSHSLRSLELNDCGSIFSRRSKKQPWKIKFRKDTTKRVIHFRCPKLRYIALRGLECDPGENLCRILSDLTLLTRLDLSDCSINFQNLRSALCQLQQLQILSLYNVVLPSLRGAFEAVAQVKSLRSLDLSQNPQDHHAVVYDDAEANMAFLIAELPLLKRLDISATNLCGFVPEPSVSHRLYDYKTKTESSQHPPVAGLQGRHLDFLGLLCCAYNACQRENLPATQVTGDATEAQILLSVKSYVDHRDLLLLSVNNLFHLFKHSHCRDHRTAMEVLLTAMECYPSDRSIQISASAALFYIVKGTSKPFFTTLIKKTIVRTLLKSMDSHLHEPLLLRNCCMTLCRLRMPHDVMHSYEWLVSTLLKVLKSTTTSDDDIVQRIVIYLLNALSCQVDYSEKRLVGQLGAFPVILSMISTLVEKGICDEVLKVAWSMLWNVTDETPSNCQMFIDGDGLDVFLACFDKFKADGDDLLRNMMGLLGNIAEVQFLRNHFMSSHLISIFRDLLRSTGDGIEVSYNACGILANIMSDGARAWTITTPSRQCILQDMTAAISQWNLNAKRNINYRSFKPILRLVSCHETPEVQYWAVWALCNLTKVYKSKYCPLLMTESGITVLKDLLYACQWSHCDNTLQLAQQIIDRCERFALDSDYVTDDEQDIAE